ncbi:ABC transporter substrate-binding protein [Paenibacillus marchantiophytorum]|uniref:ABC transporter substrate-binding protein n=1 Tax=Paenibacillus marchantiophytorum TaxID=1619310 RepID=A0ABQ1F1L1_9BACL|nr:MULTISPECIES: tripartite tricarboxylate transporter substrate binding protein [Paenibacillus]UKS25675.1 tripartite tricarboxylate transporter substrate binding protein [Paenibacillus sp. HWE-109]GFZ97103.1 ABC transporter substrate-binding protein [Paenibacillus marchantiophytorum]
MKKNWNWNYAAVGLSLLAITVLSACGSSTKVNTAASSAAVSAAPKGSAAPSAGTSYPTRPIQILVPFSAGGATDLSLRALAPKLEKILGQKVEVIDKPGGAGALSMNEVIKAKPDGYTVGFTSVGPGIITPLTTEVGYTTKDFDAVGGYMDNPYALAVSADSKYGTLEELVTDIKANPNKVKVGTTGPSSPSYIGLQQFAKTQDLKFQLVPYNGGVDAVNALLGHNLDAIVNVDSEILSYVKDKKFKALAIVTKKRSAILPDVKTSDEQNFKGLTFAPPPGGLIVPKGTPADVVAKLSDALKQATADADVKKSFDNIFIEPIFSSAAEFRKAYDETAEFYAQNLKK